MKKLVVGILAHVDAGKTTLSEALLYTAGAVRKLGRVDHRDAFLDTDDIERERGITILAKQAELNWKNLEVTLLDTPGHVDFSAEMERTLQVLDCAVLVLSGTDGVQGHTATLWRLLERYGVPTVLFVNKMDLAGADREALLRQLRSRLHENCVDFTDRDEAWAESVAVADEALLEAYFAGEPLTDGAVAACIGERKLFPCLFGSALRLDGVEALLDLLRRYVPAPRYGEAFAARVFKIAREGGERLTYLKVTGGVLRVKDTLSGEDWKEKVNQIRRYSGAKFRQMEAAEAGTVCAVTGLTHTWPGQGLGAEAAGEKPALEPVMTYRLLLPEGCDCHTFLGKLRQLEEEDPQLGVVWNEALGEIHVRLMGEVQQEVLRRRIADRFGTAVDFDQGSILYKETIAAPVVGVGHFEPLRHYAEVHLLLEPGERGSGLRFASAVGADDLDLNWQRLILTHLGEKEPVGVLTGSPVTDVKITILAGRGHLKHTEGGDFRQATYRAVRQGLRQAETILLEPWYAFRLEAPRENLGRAMADLQKMGGTFAGEEGAGELAALAGEAPAAAMGGYWQEVAAYTRGCGQLSCSFAGYRPCADPQAVVDAIGYDCDRDVENTADSVFCEHGAGVVVPWDQVPARAHVTSGYRLRPAEEERSRRFRSGGAGAAAGDRELEEIFVRTYGPIKNRGMDALRQSRRIAPGPSLPNREQPAYVQKGDWLLVDGYNIIFAWEELNGVAKESLDDAREALLNALGNYRGIKECHVTVVFDAYKVPGGTGNAENRGGVEVVYTKEGETADMYIERVSYELARKYRVKVATSDGLEQIMILGHGAQRVSAGDLRWELDQVNAQIQDFLREQQS